MDFWKRCGGKRRKQDASKVHPDQPDVLAKLKKEESVESRNRVSQLPNPEYTRFGEKARLLAPPGLQCALFCGGAKCKYEQPLRFPPDAMALQGIYSNWITEDILAMARPNTTGIQKYNIIEQFHSWGVRTLINLQYPGEHAWCGHALDSSGFSYNPDLFMKNEIFVYNFAWKDYEEADVRSLLSMIKVMQFSISKGRVAVHCHAGLGRTGVLISCYLVHSLRLKANDAVRLVRKMRPHSVQTSGQIMCVQQFEQYVLPQTIVFSCRDSKKSKKLSEFTLRQHLHRQMLTLHGTEEIQFKYLPKIVFRICERILTLSGDNHNHDLLFATDRNFIRTFLIYKLLKQDNPKFISKTTGSTTGYSTSDSMAIIDKKRLYEALLQDYTNVPGDVIKKMKELKDEINASDVGYSLLDLEHNIDVLCGLLFHWLEGLKKPVLDREDLINVILKGQNTTNCYGDIQFEKLILVEYLIRFLLRIEPLNKTSRRNIMKRIIAALTHQSIEIETKVIPKSFPKIRDGTCDVIMNFMMKFMDDISKYFARPNTADSDLVILEEL